MSSSNCCFLTCIQISQEAGQVVSYSHLFQNFPQFSVIHTVKGFGIVNKAEIDVFFRLFLLFWWSSGCWQFDLWFLYFFWNQFEHLEVHSSCTVEAWLQEFLTLLACAAAAAKSLQSCPTLCDLKDGSPPGYPIPGILHARTLEWVAISFSNAGKWKVKVKSPSRVRLFATPWTAAYHAPPSMGFSRQEYWSGVPLPSPTCNQVRGFCRKFLLGSCNFC